MSQIFWWFLGFLVGTVAHEAGHLLCARIGSIPIDRMVIGSGPVLLCGRIGELRLELRGSLLGSGFVRPVALGGFQKRWLALFLLGGVIGNAAVIGVVAWLDAVGAAPTILRDIAAPLVFSQAVIIVTSLIPYRTRVDGRLGGSDGLQLLGLLFDLRKFSYAIALDRYGGGRRPPAASPASGRIAQQIGHPERWTDEDVRRDAHEALRRELAQGVLSPDEEMLVLDALVTDGLIFADPALRPELDEWSLRALRLGPEVSTLVGSRGAVLVELGRYPEGKALLETVAFADEAVPFDSLITRIFLARAEHALGNAAAVRGLMTGPRAIARTGAAGPAVTALIGRIESEMQAVP
jgi:hypothetical protein